MSSPASQPDNSARAGTVALDQWRGLALLLVILAHALHETKRMDGLGRVGVNLFFFISGILVFRSLSGSREARPGKIIVNFWHRRLRRLYPALLAYVAVIVIAQYWLQNLPGIPAYSTFANCLRIAPAALLYFENYSHLPPLSLGHLWSLSCEMQFYLLAPLIFFLGGRASRRRNLVFGGFLVVLMGLGISEPLILTNPSESQKYHFEFAVWPMMAGFCCEYGRQWFQRVPVRWVTAVYWGILGLCLLGVPLMFAGPKMKMPVIACGALLLVPCLIAYDRGWPVAAVPGRVLKWLGERTYSIYLWQQPLTICGFLPVKWWPAGAVAAVLLGALWFRWFEQPFLSVSRREIIRQK